jgi:hypothetical protein
MSMEIYISNNRSGIGINLQDCLVMVTMGDYKITGISDSVKHYFVM